MALAAEKGATRSGTVRHGRIIRSGRESRRCVSGHARYRQAVELRQLEAFVAVATELHFGRAAERLHLAAPTLSELIRRLERELGTPLFTRTTRRVAMTSAGAELLARAKVILDEVAAADAAVRRVAAGEAGTVRLGITPPVAPVLAPHLIGQFTTQAPHVIVNLQRMWLPAMTDALIAGRIDVAITCGLIPAPEGIANEVFCAEPLLVGLRPGHRLAGQDTIALHDLAHDVLGRTSADLFPAWASSQQQALHTAGISPPAIDLTDTELAATRWADQRDIAWILLVPSLAAAHTTTTVIRPVEPAQLVPFTLQWNPSRAHTTAVARFVHAALTAELPPGWHTQPDHLHHRE
jgi:DNA-binding transcriptional LysR family regulator